MGMGSPLEKLLNNPENFLFYTTNQKGFESPNNQNPRTIPFGRDRINNGSSNQPYIYENRKQKVVDVSGKNTSFFNDFIIRGGLLSPIRAVEDVLRLIRFFADIKNPRGLLFLAKENLLSRVGTKTESSKGIGYAGGFLNEGAYTPLSTIGQALIGFAGGHLKKQGIDPTGLITSLSINTYQDIIAKNQINRGSSFDFSDNRLTSLYTYTIDSENYSAGNSFNGVLGYSLTPSDGVLLQYGGGPGSILGIGKTKINYATTNDGKNPLKTLIYTHDPTYLTKEDPNVTVTLQNQHYIPNSSFPDTKFSNKIANEMKKGEEMFSPLPGLNHINIPLPSSLNPSELNNSTGSKSYEEIYNSTKPSWIKTNPIDSDSLINFSITIVNPLSPQNEKRLNFIAYIDNFSDTYNASWKEQSYVGRGEKFQKYNGFDRSISLGFTIVANNEGELFEMYEKLNYLAGSLSPTY